MTHNPDFKGMPLFYLKYLKMVEDGDILTMEYQ